MKTHQLFIFFILLLPGCITVQHNNIHENIDENYIAFADNSCKNFSIICGYVDTNSSAKQPILKIGHASFILPENFLKPIDGFQCSYLEYGFKKCFYPDRKRLFSSGYGSHRVMIDGDFKHIYIMYRGYEFTVNESDGKINCDESKNDASIYTNNIIYLPYCL